MIEIIELHCDDEERTLLAWGIHAPAAFVAAAVEQGLGNAFSDVEHQCWHLFPKAKGGPRYEEVWGEPNATVCSAYWEHLASVHIAR